MMNSHGIPFKALATGGLAMGSITKGLEQKNGRTNTRTPRTVDGHAGCKNTETTLCATSLNPTKKILTTFVNPCDGFRYQVLPKQQSRTWSSSLKIIVKMKEYWLGMGPTAEYVGAIHPAMLGLVLLLSYFDYVKPENNPSSAYQRRSTTCKYSCY